MTYSFKGRGILWHSQTGPVKWWPINWFWLFVVNFEQQRQAKREEAAEAAAAKAADAKGIAAEAEAAKPAEAAAVVSSEALEPPAEPAASPADAAATAVVAGPIAEAIIVSPASTSDLAPPPPPEPEHLGEPDKPAEPPKT
ncbi:hypothetical protein [Blastochloris viridis]|uniref:Uncharacterized protein n=1 Tax=Blastochloris viridis TaxID=1079 RepID=A0A0P0J5C1_BLAVI|nr:hypothetical protein [Blastochloris viridis]ALK08615.1 hypothetical protein BVIR_822 [Blastochloris viridis]CUU41278.1 hypothetical protein BVIRIDIS_02670 [Blastochloris viridis]